MRMRDKSPDPAALIRAGRTAFRPESSDRERVLRSLTRALGDGAFLDDPPPPTRMSAGASRRLRSRCGLGSLADWARSPSAARSSWLRAPGRGRRRKERFPSRSRRLPPIRRPRPPSRPHCRRPTQRRSPAWKARRARRDRQRDPRARHRILCRRKSASCREPSSSSTRATPRRR